MDKQQPADKGDQVRPGHDDGDALGGHSALCRGLQGEVGGIDEEDGHEQEHGQDIDEIRAERGAGGAGFFCVLGLIQPVAGQEAQAEDDTQQAQQIDQKAGPPVQLRQQPRQQRGDDAAHLVHGRSVPHEGRLPLRGIVKGQQAGGERHQMPTPTPTKARITSTREI